MAFARVLGVLAILGGTAVGGYSLYNHRIALHHAEDARDQAQRSLEDQKHTVVTQQHDLERLKAELERANANVAAMESAKGELQKAKEEAEARATLFNGFVKTFQKMIQAGRLQLTVRHGRIVLALQSEVLFDKGKAEIRPDGKAALAEIAEALKGVKGRQFQVAGHTDAHPIHNSEFASNWELSSARATEVVKLLASEGVPPQILSGSGYAEYQPVATNQTHEGRAKNRRIEITLEPNVGQLLAMPQLKM
jgi:chemotaxis protein MotB